MKYLLLLFIVLCNSSAHAQFIPTGTATANDMIRQQRWADNNGNNGYYVQDCSADGAMVWDVSALRERCINFADDLVIDETTTPPTLRVAGLDTNTDSITTMLIIIADLESTIAALQDTVATLDSNLNDLATEVSGKFDTPSGTVNDYIRGDGSIAPFPEP